MTEPEIFEPYERLIDITIFGERRLVPEKNSLLRCLQFLEMDTVSDSELCWNGECMDCQVWIKNGDNERSVMACRTNAEEGMEIVRLSETIRFR
jgi:hypothetical protein